MHRRKAQVSIMEYILLTFFILVVILGLLFFLSWWQFTQLGMQEHRLRMDRVIFLAKYVSSSPYFVKESAVFDDAKLTAIQSLGSGVCRDFEGILGDGWFIRVRVFEGDEEIPCTWTSYPSCNLWEFCTREQKNTSRTLPVNIYRKVTEENGVGMMEVGVYI
jgi:hypothetical protein